MYENNRIILALLKIENFKFITQSLCLFILVKNFVSDLYPRISTDEKQSLEK